MKGFFSYSLFVIFILLNIECGNKNKEAGNSSSGTK